MKSLPAIGRNTSSSSLGAEVKLSKVFHTDVVAEVGSMAFMHKEMDVVVDKGEM